MYLRTIGRRFTQMIAYFLVMNSKSCSTRVSTKWSHDHVGHLISGHVTYRSRYLDKDNDVDAVETSI